LKKTTFSTRLNKCLSDCGITQDKLEELTGIKRSTIAGYASGASSPKYEQLVLLADTLKVSTDYLLGRTDIKSPDMEIRAISEYIGIPEEAVSKFAFYKRHFAQNFLPVAFTHEFFRLSIHFDKIQEYSEMLSDILNTFPLTDDIINKYPDFLGNRESYEDYCADDCICSSSEAYAVDNWISAVLDIRKELRNEKYDLLESLSFWAESIGHASQVIEAADTAIDEKMSAAAEIASSYIKSNK